MEQRVFGNLPRPSKALIALLAVIGCLWVLFAVGVNWGGSGSSLFALLIGDSEAVVHGQLWRLVSAPLMHAPNRPTHALFSMLMLYFFVPALEERWGVRRTYLFLFGSAAFAYGIESLAYVALPAVANASWFGAMVMADAALVAWAIQNRDKVINLMFVLPIKALVMVGLLLAWHVVLLIARSAGPEGMLAPFGAALAGWLFCDTGPARRAYLHFKLRRLQNQVDGISKKRASRRAASHLKVIKGGADDDDNLH